MNLKRSLLMKGSPKICPQTGLSVSDVANASPQLFNEDESSISALLNGSKSISVPESPNSIQKACSGAVRNMVNRLPFELCEQSDKAGEQLGERSIATDSPFSASAMSLKALLLSLSMTKRSGLLVNGRKSDGYMQFDPCFFFGVGHHCQIKLFTSVAFSLPSAVLFLPIRGNNESNQLENN